MTHYLALLRGINVGGRNIVPMKELRAVMEAGGLQNVATYVQSGNLLFDSDQTDAVALAGRLQRLINERFDTTTPVVIRTAGEMARVVASNPFLDDEPEFKWLHAIFLDAAPDASAINQLDPGRSPGDRFAVAGREIFVHFPNGSGRSKLTINYFERILGVTATGRNWNTVNKLHAMLQERVGG